MTAATVPAALAAALRSGALAAQPVITYLGADGERTELSLRTWENNVAKTANLLRDDADAGPGSTVAVRLPVHWQTSVWLGAAAMVGALASVVVATDEADVAVLGPSTLDESGAPLTLATALHPFGLPFATPMPIDVLDAAVEVRAHGDVFVALPDVVAATPWIQGDDGTLTQSDALAAAADLAAALGLSAGGRLLCTALDVGRTDVLLALVAVPLVLGGSVVLLVDPAADPDVVADRERCTARLA